MRTHTRHIHQTYPPPPPQAVYFLILLLQLLHLLLCLKWSHREDPSHNRHNCFCFPCLHRLPPPHSLHSVLRRACSHIVCFVLGSKKRSPSLAQRACCNSGVGIRLGTGLVAAGKAGLFWAPDGATGLMAAVSIASTGVALTASADWTALLRAADAGADGAAARTLNPNPRTLGAAKTV